MNDRLVGGKRLLIPDNFVQFIAIDEIEQELLGQDISRVFPENKKIVLVLFIIREDNKERIYRTLMNLLL